MEKFKSNMQERNVLNRIKILQGYSHEIIKTFNEPIDVLFIDGNMTTHLYCAIIKWSKLIKRWLYSIP